jgi:hypothetical protein
MLHVVVYREYRLDRRYRIWGLKRTKKTLGGRKKSLKKMEENLGAFRKIRKQEEVITAWIALRF